MKPNPHPVQASIRRRFLDFFERDNTSSGLGRSLLGGFWDKFQDFSFRILDNRAVTDDDPNTYPQTNIEMTEADVDLYMFDIDNGSAASIWVTDSGDWFAVGVDQHPVDCNCEVGTECNRWNGSNITGWTTTETGGRNRFTFASGEYCREFVVENSNPNYRTRCVPSGSVCTFRPAYNAPCTQWRRTFYCYQEISGYNATRYATECNTNFSTAYNSPNFTTNIDGYNENLCNRWNEFTFNCDTCYPQWIRLLQSVGGTVSVLSQDLVSKAVNIVKSPNETLDLYVQENPIVEFVRSWILRISGNEIVTELYSDPNGIDKIEFEDGDIVYNPTGAEITARYGIMITPSEYNQQNFVGGFQVIRDDF